MITNEQAFYFSGWDVDQLIVNTQVSSVPIAVTSLFGASITLYTHGLSFVPIVDAQWHLAGETIWRQFGDVTTVAGPDFIPFLNVDSTGVNIQYYSFTSTRVIDVRIQVWTDKVTY